MLEILRRERQQPTDAPLFVSSDSQDENQIALRQQVQADLQRDLDTAIQTRSKSEVMHQLSAAYADLEVPKGLVEIELDALLAQAPANGPRAKDEATPDSSLASEAQRRVRAFIVLAEIARQNEIAPDQQRINTTLAQIAAQYDDPESVIELYTTDSDLMASLRNRDPLAGPSARWALAWTAGLHSVRPVRSPAHSLARLQKTNTAAARCSLSARQEALRSDRHAATSCLSTPHAEARL